MKKIIHIKQKTTITLAAMMLAGSLASPVLAGIPAFAAVKQGKITALGIKEAGVTVMAYPIVQGTYSATDTNGVQKLLGYSVVRPDKITLTNMAEPDSDEISEIAAYLRKGVDIPTGIEMNEDEEGSGTYSADVDPGEYIVLVSGSGDTIYNPGVVSLNVQDSLDVTNKDPYGDSLNFEDYFKYPSEAWLKASKPVLSKTVSTGDEKDRKGVTAAAGDDLEFKLNTTIPYYTEQYTTINYQLSDSLEEGKFSAITGVKVEVDGSPVQEDSGDYQLTLNEGKNHFEMVFNGDFIRDHGGEKLIVTYQSKLLTGADNNFAENMNRATLTYSNDPGHENSTAQTSDTTYQYMFGIDASLDAEETNQTETSELNKVLKESEESGGIKTDYEEVKFTNGKGGTTTTQKSENPLEGASFALYSTSEMEGDAIRTATSDERGHVKFTGLDAGTYYLKETEAPSGYTLNTQIYSVTITAVPDEETGVLSNYKVTVRRLPETSGQKSEASSSSGEAAGTSSDPGTEVGAAEYSCTATVDKETGAVTNTNYQISSDPAEILNTNLPDLPSTGGEGIYGFVLAAAAMGSGLVVWEIVSRKKRKNL